MFYEVKDVFLFLEVDMTSGIEWCYYQGRIEGGDDEGYSPPLGRLFPFLFLFLRKNDRGPSKQCDEIPEFFEIRA